MKQQRITDYRPNYPKKILKGAAITTAAVLALGASVACTELRTGGMPEPEPTEELQLDGYMMPEPEPTDDLTLSGEVAVDEPTEEPLIPDGDVMVAPEEP